MSDRPTPEQMARAGFDALNVARLGLLAQLAEHGYVIVHPDDVPSDSPNSWGGHAFDEGWNACRSRIFGGAS